MKQKWKSVPDQERYCEQQIEVEVAVHCTDNEKNVKGVVWSDITLPDFKLTYALVDTVKLCLQINSISWSRNLFQCDQTSHFSGGLEDTSI